LQRHEEHEREGAVLGRHVEGVQPAGLLTCCESSRPEIASGIASDPLPSRRRRLPGSHSISIVAALAVSLLYFSRIPRRSHDVNDG
jgi:hypothetical protein